MLEPASVTRNELTVGQLRLIARKYSAFSGKSFIDVGCGNGEWLLQERSRGRMIQGMEENVESSAPTHQAIVNGSPAATVPWEPHTQDRILFRGTSAFRSEPFSPEQMIALANLGSSLKKNGRLLIPLMESNPTDFENEVNAWKSQLGIFPGTIRVRTLTSGLRGYLTLAFLLGRTHRVSLIEFNVTRRLISRLEWHQLARNAVMSRLNTPRAA